MRCLRATLLVASIGLLSIGCATGKSPSGGDAGADEEVDRSSVRLVSGGVKASSPNYQLVTTMGESPGTTGKSSSPGCTLEGGVVGAAESMESK
jgi:hypothetical protein